MNCDVWTAYCSSLSGDKVDLLHVTYMHRARCCVCISLLRSRCLGSSHNAPSPTNGCLNQNHIPFFLKLTKALFGLEKLWKLGTPLLLSMLTITPSRFQTSIVFFLRNSHLISTFSLCFYPYFSFYLTFFVYIIFILYSIFIRRRL